MSTIILAKQNECDFDRIGQINCCYIKVYEGDEDFIVRGFKCGDKITAEINAYDIEYLSEEMVIAYID